MGAALTLSMLANMVKKFSRPHFKIFFIIFPRKKGVDISCKLSKCQNLFSWKNRQNVINLSSAESALRMVKVKKK